MNLSSKSVVLFLAGTLLALPTANATPHRLAPAVGAELGLAQSSCPKSGCEAAGQTFSLFVPPSGEGAFYLTNDSGINWSNLELTETGVPASDITCMQNLFATCSVSSSNGITTVFLTGVNSRFGGIDNGETFVLGFDCNGCNNSHNGLNIAGKGNFQVPEAGSFEMLLVVLPLGFICAVIVYRRKQVDVAALSSRN